MKLSKTLSKPEREKLETLEGVIQEGFNAMTKLVDANKALKTIRDEKLFREGYATFEDYCHGEFNRSRQQINAYINAGDVIRALPPAQAEKVSSVNAANALKRVPPPERPRVVEEASKDGPATERSIKAASKKSPPASTSVHVESETGVSAPLDGTGLKIPSSLFDTWDRLPEIKSQLNGLAMLKSWLKENEDDPILAEVLYQEAVSGIDNVKRQLGQMVPYAVCPTCQGKLMDQCTFCKGRGWVSKHRWDVCATEEDKSTRRKLVEQKAA